MSDYTEYYEYYKKAWEKSLSERTSELQAENARLREALEFYADISVWGNGCAAIDPCDTYTCYQGVLRGGKCAIEALKGGE